MFHFILILLDGVECQWVSWIFNLGISKHILIDAIKFDFNATFGSIGGGGGGGGVIFLNPCCTNT